MKKFVINYTFQGSATQFIEAKSLEEAEAKITAQIDSDDFDIDAEEFDDVNYRISEMHPVTRDGQEKWTTRILPTDIRGHALSLKETPLFGEKAAS